MSFFVNMLHGRWHVVYRFGSNAKSEIKILDSPDFTRQSPGVTSVLDRNSDT